MNTRLNLTMDPSDKCFLPPALATVIHLQNPRPSPLPTPMPDHPLKQGLDRRLVSTQAHEQSYLKRTLRKRYPWRDRDEISFAIVAARMAVAPS